MSIELILAILLPLITTTMVGWRYVLPAIGRARKYSRQVATCGYLSPPPTPRALRWGMRLARLLAFIQVGRIKIIGRENLAKADGPFLVTPNHPHWADAVTMPILINGPARYMAAQEVFTFAGGLGGLLVAPLGAFSADLTHGKGGPAREAAIDVLTSGQRLVMFPEGYAYLDGHLGEFKKGAVRIAREASRRLGKMTYVIPVNLRYGRYPGSWIRKFPPPVQYLLVFLLSALYRRGLTMVVGEPIPVDKFSTNDVEATEQLKQAIIALDPALRKETQD